MTILILRQSRAPPDSMWTRHCTNGHWWVVQPSTWEVSLAGNGNDWCFKFQKTNVYWNRLKDYIDWGPSFQVDTVTWDFFGKSSVEIVIFYAILRVLLLESGRGEGRSMQNKALNRSEWTRAKWWFQPYWKLRISEQEIHFPDSPRKWKTLKWPYHRS